MRVKESYDIVFFTEESKVGFGVNLEVSSDSYGGTESCSLPETAPVYSKGMY